MKKIVCVLLLLSFICSFSFSATSTSDLKKFIGNKVIVQYSNYDKEIVGILDSVSTNSYIIASITIVKDNGDIVVVNFDNIASVTIVKEK